MDTDMPLVTPPAAAPWHAHGAVLAGRGWCAVPIAPPGGRVARFGPSQAAADDFRRNLGKAPGLWTPGGWRPLVGWRQQGVPSPEKVRTFAAWPGAGVGIVLGPQGDGSHVIAVDADVMDARLAAELDQMAVTLLAPGPRRIGRAPKWARLFRTDDFVGKMMTGGFVLPFDEANSKAHRVEVLGAGQQVVAYGRHPSGSEYHWPDGAAPHNTSPAGLPCVSEADLQRFLHAASHVLMRDGVPVSGGGRRRGADAGVPDKPRGEYLAKDRDLCVEAARHLDLSDMSRDAWVAFAHALKGALGDNDEARDLWVDLTLKSLKSSGDPTAALRVWDSIADSALRSGAGTVFHLALEQGWRPPPGRDFDAIEDAAGPQRFITLAEAEAATDAMFADVLAGVVAAGAAARARGAAT